VRRSRSRPKIHGLAVRPLLSFGSGMPARIKIARPVPAPDGDDARRPCRRPQPPDAVLLASCGLLWPLVSLHSQKPSVAVLRATSLKRNCLRRALTLSLRLLLFVVVVAVVDSSLRLVPTTASESTAAVRVGHAWTSGVRGLRAKRFTWTSMRGMESLLHMPSTSSPVTDTVLCCAVHPSPRPTGAPPRRSLHSIIP